MATLSGVIFILLVTTGAALECLFCMNANQQLDHCHPITCAQHEECFFERTVDLDTYDILHNAGCRDRALCQYITMVGQGKKRRRSVVVKRGDIQTSAPVEYRSCYDCCGTPGTSGQPCNALLCHQNSTHTTASH
ncbi:uncharacterized protein LOC117340055 isoform X1 [Pecten maximus]|uniref:uncharacterized protein LOC117340055 isoform X1 n=1 Tax=Pecten maximus TaxID=6579 RepID=UPI0014581C97|nr:uncharacterized protein LOC117340055 isoform X1 [Pecten maximus]